MTADTPKIAYIQARWHADIVDRALVGFEERMAEAGNEMPVEMHSLAGAFELPLVAKRLAQRDDIACVVAAGFVVDGGIYRHDFVAGAVVSGLMQVQLETDTPVFSVVLTPHNFQETEEHIGFFKAHFVTKGREAADAVMGTLAVHEALAAA
ncbi:MAG: 6,7-dimethyl-8-ribityllumazine synthase [Rhodospirillales bacterium]|nr:6,7-dimethyl-8-ribityllumazine synthase [Rhodospirillales bacterium]MBO6785293.1 6,7-dimethyl-8-ribityllumazine synthase [Rhodospirillales bacterium]